MRKESIKEWAKRNKINFTFKETKNGRIYIFRDKIRSEKFIKEHFETIELQKKFYDTNK